MKQVTLFLLLLFKGISILIAQQNSLVQKQDSIVRKNDSIQKKIVPVRNDSAIIKNNLLQQDTTLKQTDSLIKTDSAVNILTVDTSTKKISISVKPVEFRKEGDAKSYAGKEALFYYLLFLLLLFGLLRRAFEKYFADLFRVFFKTSMKQGQAREQMLHAQLPSVFMNIFFVLSAGLYINFLLVYFRFSIAENFWQQYAYCAVGLGIIYLVKFFGLKLTGWVLNVQEATESYIFIVFMINKMMGISLLPFLFLLAFTTGPLPDISLSLSFILIGLLLTYRIILSYTSLRNEIRLNSFHFVLYVLAFEVLPLLLIYKALMIIL